MLDKDARISIYGEGIVHLVASGFNQTMCGKDSKIVKHTSLGMCCNCEECLKIAQKILDKQSNEVTKRASSHR